MYYPSESSFYLHYKLLAGDGYCLENIFRACIEDTGRNLKVTYHRFYELRNWFELETINKYLLLRIVLFVTVFSFQN